MADTRRSPPPPLIRSAGAATRRATLALFVATLAHARRADAAVATDTALALADAPSIVVAGPAGGRLDRWAPVLAAALLPALPAGTMLQHTAAGGEDGVTGANQFATRVAPDGNTLLLVPGAAALAWLVGDMRAKFDAARWLAVLAGVAPAVVVSQLDPARLRPGQILRVGMAGPVSPDMAAALAVEVMGCVPVPVFGVLDRAAAGQALAAGVVDVVLLRGHGMAAQLSELTAHGAAPLFALGAADGEGRDAALPGVPALAELASRIRGNPPAGLLYEACRAVAAATQTEFVLVLPHLTPAALVALWRQAGAHAAAAPELRDGAAAIRTVATSAASTLTHALAPNSAAVTELRSWLAARLNWRPA